MSSLKTAVSNSGPLIHLGSVGLLDLLFKLYDRILIPESVYDEVIVKGKKEGHSDTILLEQAISDNKIQVKGTLGILIDLVKNNYLKLENAFYYLRELNSIMYLSSNVYNYVADELKKINRKQS